MSSNANSDATCPLLKLGEDNVPAGGGGGGRFDFDASGALGAEECLCPNRPPSRLCFCCVGWEPPPNGVDRVALLAFFSRSSIFFLNCLASFSSTKLSAARQSSSSKV